MPQPIFAEGIFFKKPREGAPEFVRGNISIKVDDFVKWIKLHVDEKGWVNLDLKRSMDGQKLYLALNNWKPKQKDGTTNP